MNSLSGRKQSAEHIAKRVATRKLKGSYTKQNFGHAPTNIKSNSGSFKKGVPHPRPKIDLDIELIKERYLTELKSTYDIGQEFNVSQKTIENRLNEVGVKLRKRGEHTPLVLEKIKQARAKQIFPLVDSSIEIKIQSFLKQLKIEFYTHQHMNIEHRYQCDIFIPSMNMVVECDGTYWHSYPTGNEIDHVRTKELIQKGFKVLRLWEYEIRDMDLIKFKEVINGR